VPQSFLGSPDFSLQDGAPPAQDKGAEGITPSCRGRGSELVTLLEVVYSTFEGPLGKAATVNKLHELFYRLLLPAASFPGPLQDRQGPDLLCIR